MFNNLNMRIVLKSLNRRHFHGLCRQFEITRKFSSNGVKYNAEDHVISSKFLDVYIPENVPVHEFIFENSRRWSNKIAVECADTGRNYTYNEIYKYASRFAYFLRKVINLKDRDTVGILLPNIPEYPILILGAMQANLKVTTINPASTPHEISQLLNVSGANILVTLNELHSNVSQAINKSKLQGIRIITSQSNSGHLPEGAISLKEILNTDRKLNEQDVSTESTALLPFSSGTTGLPKGVQLTHKNLVSNICQQRSPMCNICRDTTDDFQETLTAVLPFFHIYGLATILLLHLSLGMKMVTTPKFNSQSFIKLLRNYRPTVAQLVPPIVLMMINNSNITTRDLKSLICVVTGAAPIGAQDLERFEKKTNGKTTILQAYGMTETSPLIMSQTMIISKGRKPGSCGLLLPNTQAKIIETTSSNLNGLGPSRTGELLIKGPQVMKGYYNNEKATRETITEDGWIKTGDIAHYDEDEHFYITDRLKELIKVKGYQVAPAELEALLRTHPCVEEAAVIGVPHEKYGEVPKAFVVLQENSKLKPGVLQDFVSGKVSEYKQLIGGVVEVDIIPKTPSGKILRKQLRNI